jgi:glycosyltransferase involved in cell wall biosynthesis
MTIVYPVNERMMLRKARDARIVRMAHALSTQETRVYLLIGKTGEKEERILEYYGIMPSDGLSIIQLPILRGEGRIRISTNQVFLWAALFRAMLLKRIEPIQVFYFSVLEVADFFLKRKGFFPNTKWIYELHELARYPENSNPSPKRIKEEALEKRVLTGMDGVFTTTDVLRQVVADRFPGLPSATIPLGMAPTSSAGRLHFGTDGKFKVGYIGQLYDAQGVDVLIKALALIPQAEAHIIGGTLAEVATLKELACEHRVSDRVVFHGFVEPGKIPALAEPMDMFVVPAKNTIRMNYVAHIKIYEYMALRRPIVATRLRSVKEELEDDKTGILVEPDDPQSLAEGIRRLMHKPVLAKIIADRAYEKSAGYHWENRAKSIVDFIDSLR